MTIEVEGPGGVVVEFPDGTSRDTINAAMQERFRPLTTSETVADVAAAAGRGALKGVTETVTIPYRLVDWLGEKATGGNFLPNVEDTAPVRYALNPPEARSRAGRWAGTIGEFAGAGVTGTGFGLALARRFPTNWFLQSYATTPRAAIATDTAASLGAGAGVEYARENDFGTAGQLAAGLGGGLGGIAALGGAARVNRGITEAARAMARGDRANAGLPLDLMWRGMTRAPVDDLGSGVVRHTDDVAGALPPGGGGGVAPPTPAQARAYQTLADTLVRAGKTPDDLRTALTEAYEATRFNSNSYAQNVAALGDLDESLMRLAGSISRQHPEASRVIREFIEARQTGHTPAGVSATEMAARGLPTRERFSQPATVGQAERTLGRRFPGDKDDILSMGMVDRSVEALKRAMLLEAHEYHGHARTGLATEGLILKRARDAAQANYDEAVTANQGVNLRDAIDTTFAKWLQDAAESQSPGVEALVKRVHGMFRSGPIELRQFDRIKREVDDIIKGFLGKANKSGVHRGGYLSDVMDDLLKAVDDSTGGEASLYRAARAEYGSDMKMIDAYKAGLKAFDDNAEVTAETFLQLATKGEQKMFRNGMIDSMRLRGQRMPRTHDFTKVFETQRVEEILAATIPRSEKSTAVFANRPVRFGKYIDTQKKTVEGRQTALGGSMTARNQADDAAFDAQRVVSGLMELGRSPSSWLINRISDYAEKAFGIDADAASALAHMLFSADSQQQLTVLREVAARMPPDRMTRFRNLMRDLERTQARLATVPNLASATAPQQQAP
jgi:hypothetical protein